MVYRNILLLTLLLGCLFAETRALKTRYDGHRVYRLTPQTEQHLAVLQDLESNYHGVDLWRHPTSLGNTVDVQIPPQHDSSVMRTLLQQEIPHSVLVNDVQSLLNKHEAQIRARRLQKEEFFENYHNFTELMDFMEDRKRKCGSRCSIFQTGTSYEGRVLKGIKITSGSGENKPAIWIDAGIHAREWVAHSTAMYIIERLVDDYDSDVVVWALLDHFDWYIYPVVNPDGYVFSWEHDRLWRKTRSVNESTDCIGVDANRNFDFQWMTIGASDEPCTNNFAGYFPLSEPECVAQADYIVNSPANWVLFLTLHSHGQLWLAPWGYTYDLPDNYPELKRGGNAAIRALESVHGTPYQFGTSANILYPSSGTSRDWAKGVPKIRFVYTIELRDLGEYGFILPPDQILPTGQETWAGIQALAEYIRDHP